MKKFRLAAALCGAASVPSLALAQNMATVVPLSTFGVNGYLAPGGSNADVVAGTSERGLAFNPQGVYGSNAATGGGDLYTTIATAVTGGPAAGTIGIISATTGALLGSLGSPTTYTGGTYAIDSIAVAGDGAIYVNNLTTNSSSSPYKIYEYANEAAGTGSSPVGPTVAFAGSVGAVRLGDDLAVTGTGASTVLASGFGAQPSGGFQNGYAITPITAPTGNTTTAVTFSGVSGHDFSSTLTFGANANTVLGSSAQIPGSYHVTTYTAGNPTGTLVGTGYQLAVNPNSGGEHLLAYDVVDGVPLLASQSTGDGHVSVYDDTDPLNPVLLVAGNQPAGATGSNGNATGQVVFGTVYNTNQVNLYTLSTGEGIAAYTVTIVHNLTYLNANGTFDTGISPSFNSPSGVTAFHTGDNVTFDDSSPSGPYTVPVSGAVSPGSTTFNNSAGNYVLTGANSSSGIAGAGSLTKYGTSAVTLSLSNSYTGSTVVNAGTLTFAGANAYPVNTTLNISSGAVVTIANHSTGAVVVPHISVLNNNGTIDITNNTLLVHVNAAIGTINAEVAQAFANGTWTGTNASTGVITSSIAAGDTTHLTAVGVATNLSTFEGSSVASTDVLVKYTYYGDANLDGKVDGSDYSLIDSGFVTGATGWQNGDFNYDGVVNGSDYTLIDNAFNTQGTSLESEIASPLAVATAEIASSSAVPEPTTLGLLGFGVMGLLGRRRRV